MRVFYCPEFIMIKRTFEEITKPVDSHNTIWNVTTEDLLGRTFIKVEASEDNKELIFESTDGLIFTFYHEQDCCESVRIEDICGELQDLTNSPLLQAEESSNHDYKSISCESTTWTFYRFATMKGSVVIRWIGESNGYYSERVDLKATTKPN